MARFEISRHGPLTEWEREAITPRPPYRPPVWTQIACHNLAWRSPLLHRDGITTEIGYSQRVVTITRGEHSILMIATDTGWLSSPPNDDLRFPLDRTVALERRIHSLLTNTDL